MARRLRKKDKLLIGAGVTAYFGVAIAISVASLVIPVVIIVEVLRLMGVL